MEFSSSRTNRSNKRWAVRAITTGGMINEAEKNGARLPTCPDQKNTAGAQKASWSFWDIYVFTRQCVDRQI